MNSITKNPPPSSSAVMLNDISRWSRTNLRYVADLILPPVCLHCHLPVSDHGVLCADCWRDIEFITHPLCDRLGLPLYHGDEDVQISAMALRHPPVFRRGRAAARFRGVMRSLIHGFKYSDRHESAGMFARLMQGAGAELIADADLLMPVPLHRSKLLKRRFNQAAILAKALESLTGLSVDLTSLQRVRSTKSQVGLPEHERRDNVRAAFSVKRRRSAALKGKTIILVDDVITTGSTLNACARVLLDAGAANVDCLAIAMVAGHDDNDEFDRI